MPTAAGAVKKPAKKSAKPQRLLIVLKVPPNRLQACIDTLRKPTLAHNSPSPSNPSPPSSELAKLRASSQGDTPSEPASTPLAADGTSHDGDPPATDASGKLLSPAPKPNLKRSTTGDTDKDTKQKGKPGPKKKLKLDDGPNDNGVNPAPPRGVKGGGTSKLGPKASLGAINAGLRALDRSGAPCKRWQRKGLALKSFTGVTWELPAWRAPKSAPTLSSIDNTFSSSVLSDNKGPQASSHTVSERSFPPGENSSNPPESSPMKPPIAVG